MNKKSSNRVSIIIAVATGLLILGAVFLLNASFSKKTNENKNANKSSTSSVSSKSSTSRSSVSSTSNSSNLDSDSSTTSQSSNRSNSSDSNSSNSSKNSSSINSDIKDGQIVAKILGRTDSTYQLEILDSKIAGSKYFTSGSKINRLTVNGVDMKEGKTYKIQLSVTDTETGFSVENFQILGEV